MINKRINQDIWTAEFGTRKNQDQVRRDLMYKWEVVGSPTQGFEKLLDLDTKMLAPQKKKAPTMELLTQIYLYTSATIKTLFIMQHSCVWIFILFCKNQRWAMPAYPWPMVIGLTLTPECRCRPIFFPGIPALICNFVNTGSQQWL